MAEARIRAVITAEDKASGVVKNFGNSVDGFGHQVAVAAKRAALALAAATTAATAFGIHTAASLETSAQGFKTLLGSAEASQKIMARIKQEAARTPFEIAGLTQATQLLSAVTKNGDRALDFVLDIGEGLAAMGRGQQELDRIAVNIQQIAATGRAFGIDIRQFAFAGIPIYEMLQEEIGLTGEALQTFIQDGGVTFELLEKLFAKATDAGGRWAGAYKNQAGTFNQLTANMKDAFAIFMSDLINNSGAFDFLKGAIKGVTDAFNGNNEAVNTAVRQISNYLEPKIRALMPQLQKFAQEILLPLARMFGETLILAIGAFLDVLNGLMPWINDNKNLILGLVVAYTTLKTAMFLQGAIQAFSGVMTAVMQSAGLATGAQGVGGLIAAVKTLGVLLATPLVFAVAIGGILYALQKVRELHGAWDAVSEAMNRVHQTEDRLIQSMRNNPNISPQRRAALNEYLRGREGLPGRQHGGSVAAGNPYVVGEAGPELFVPSQSGSVVPNNKMGGAQTINFNVNIGMFAGTAVERRKIAQTMLDDLKDVAHSQGITLDKLVAR